MATADAPFGLADARLGVPSSRPGTVTKADVIARLQASRHPVVTVTAPAGYGKTTLLTQWAKADPRPFAWVSLDGQDADAVVFLRSVAVAVHRVEPLAPGVFDALSGPGQAIWGTGVRSVGSALAALEHPLVLVLDDLHAAENPLCLDIIATLLGYLPAGSQIAITSREEPALPLARWRAEGMLHELGVTDLRFDVQQAELLLKAAGLELDSVDVADLTERTEGWPAGLYLAALSEQTGTAGPGSAKAINGGDRFVSDYFRLEVLSRLPEGEARFLKRTSVLDKMSGALCDSVLKTTLSANALDLLGRSNYFVVRLDQRGDWYRYHHLFGQLLRSELDRTEPGAAAVINSRAAAWCADHDMAEAAVRYAHAAGDTETVAGLVDRLALTIYYDGRIETVEKWLGWFSDSDLVKYPAIAVYGAWIRALTGRLAEAERWLSLAGGAALTIPLSDGSPTIEPWVANVRAYMMAGGLERALTDADVALEQLAPGSGWRPSALSIRGVAHVLRGEGDLAKADLAAAVDAGQAIGAVDDVFVALAELALLEARRGAWGEAGRHASQAQTLVEETGLNEYLASAIVHVAVARVALHEGKRADARAALQRAHRLRPLLDGLPWLMIQVGHELTRAHLALSEAAAARTVFAEAQQMLEQYPDLGFLVEDARELGEHVAATSGRDGAWAMSLTRAELRLLPYLATHLTFSGIASRLFITANTVKAEAAATYRKLGASSRSQAIERAIEVGLLEGSIYPERMDLTLDD